MVDRSSPAAAKTLGAIFLVAGLCVLGLALWRQFGTGEAAANHFIAGALLTATGVMVVSMGKREGGDDAR